MDIAIMISVPDPDEDGPTREDLIAELTDEHNRAEALGKQRNAFAGSLAEFLARFGYDQPWMWDYVERPCGRTRPYHGCEREELTAGAIQAFNRLANDVKGIL